MNLGEKIKHERLKLGYTQKELANYLKLSISTISLYEKNMRLPDKDTITKLSELFNVTTDYLLIDNISPGNTQHSKKDIQDLNKFLNNTEILFDGEEYKLDAEDRQKLRNALEFAFWEVKKRNKRK